MEREKIKQEWIEKLINCKYNGSNDYYGAPSSSKKSHDKIEKMDDDRNIYKKVGDGEMQLMEAMKHQKFEQIQQSNSRRVKKDSNDEMVQNKEKHSAIPTPNLKNVSIQYNNA
ncbi:uncharacterized protein G2W53_029537 [Senna tora]|uniref:Uncharacterized protein n=1 Tax=Senna tora TaxID=362788 RepID=A0A834WBY9_9FABA|nr:uncharacterized protein G2W53_029537 [Senna tora]